MDALLFITAFLLWLKLIRQGSLIFKPRLEPFHRNMTGVEPERERGCRHKHSGGEVANDGGETQTERKQRQRGRRRRRRAVGGLSAVVLCTRVRNLLVFVELFMSSSPRGVPAQFDSDTKEAEDRLEAVGV